MKGRGYRKGDGGQVYYGYWKTEKRRPISIGLDWQVVCGQTGAGRVPKPESIQVVYGSFKKFRLTLVSCILNLSCILPLKVFIVRVPLLFKRCIDSLTSGELLLPAALQVTSYRVQDRRHE